MLTSHYRPFRCSTPWASCRLAGRYVSECFLPQHVLKGSPLLVNVQATAGLTITAAKPRSPAAPPTSDSVIEGAFHTKADFIYSSPFFIEVRLRYSYAHRESTNRGLGIGMVQRHCTNSTTEDAGSRNRTYRLSGVLYI